MAANIWQVNNTSDSKKSDNWLFTILASNRGLTTKAQIDEFINPQLEHILNVKLTDTKRAVKRIEDAIANMEKIVVYSDYDADGLCATAIMWETLYDLGAKVLPHVPHRIKEGYGLSIATIDNLLRENTNLIITVDHGVTAIEQVEHAKKLGIDVIITDHHVIGEKSPQPYALVHSLDLCGAGVSWRLCWEIVKYTKPSYKEALLEKLELAALATIADLVPLLAANRAIVKIGLEKIAKTKRPGIKALIKSAAISNNIGTYEIGHILAPRINAMGRIEHGLDSLRLLCAKSQKKADQLAALLAKTNTRRQDLTTSAIDHALKLVQEDHLVGVIAHESWHEGIIGLVASRLVENYNRPMVIIARGEIYSKGSARSIPGFNIIEAIRASSEFLVDAGGHPMAAGFTIETRHIEAFTKKLNTYAASRLSEENFVKRISVECELETADINRKTLGIIKLFEPYGMANREPLFLTKNMLVEDIRGVGALNKHLKLQVNGFGAIGFNMGELRSELRPRYSVDLVYTLAEDHYNGNGQIQLKIKDLTINN